MTLAKHLVNVRLCILFILTIAVVHPQAGYSQDSLQQKSTLEKIADSLLLDDNPSKWSLRAIANFKDHRLKLRNDVATIEYTPTNRAGIGMGFATSKMLIDIIINLKTNDEERTDRFDMQGNLLLGQELLLFQVQTYLGFQVGNPGLDVAPEFRRDIQSNAASLTWLHIFNSNIRNIPSIYFDISELDIGGGSWLAGLYITYHTLRADSSIVPTSSQQFFNEQANIVNATQFAFGVTGGYNYFLVLPSDFFVLASFAPGVGLSTKSVVTESESFNPSNILSLYAHINLSFGYNGPLWYIDLSNDFEYYGSSFGFGNIGIMNSLKFKLAVGWKFRNKK